MSEAVHFAASQLTGLAATRARRVVATAFFVNGAAFASWASRIPALRAGLQLSNGALGSVLFALSVGVLLSFPIASKGSQWLGARQLTLLSGLLTLALLPMPFMIGIVPSLVLVMLEMGIANGIMQVSMNVLAVDVQARIGRPILSSLHGLWSAGGLVGAGLGSLAAHARLAPWMHLGAVAMVLGVALVASAIAARSVPGAMPAPEGTAPVGRHATATAIAIAIATAAVSSTSNPTATPVVLPREKRRGAIDTVLVGLGVICFCSFLTEGALADWSAVYLRDSTGASDAVAALGYAVFAGAMTGMRLAGDWLLARFGTARPLRALNAVGAVALAVALAVGRIDVSLLAFAVMGLGLATVVPSAFGAAARHAGELARQRGRAAHPAHAIALASGFGYTGLLAGPPVIGWLAQACGLPWALGLLAALTGAIALLAPLLERHASEHPGTAPRGAAATS